MTIKVKIANEGSVNVTEVVQIYARADDPDEVRNCKLVGFGRVACEAGENASFVLEIPSDNFRVVRQDGRYELPLGEISIYAGFGQPDERTAELTGNKSVCLEI